MARRVYSLQSTVDSSNAGDISNQRSVIGKRRGRGGARRALTTRKHTSPVPLPLTFAFFSLVPLTRFLALDQENPPEHPAPQAVPPPETRAASRLSGTLLLAFSAIGFLAVLFAAAHSSGVRSAWSGLVDKPQSQNDAPASQYRAVLTL